MRQTKVLTSDRALAETWLEVPIRDGLAVINAALGSHFRVLLGQDCRVVIIGGSSGRRCLIRLEQDGTGSRVVTTDATFKAALTVSSAAGAVTWLETAYDDLTGLWEAVATSGASGANTALSNLAAVAINAALLPDGDNTRDLGSAAFSWRTLYAETSVLTPVVNGGTTITIYGASSTAALYIDANGIGAYISGKPVSVWYGSLLSVDAAISVGAVGTSGFTKSNSGASGNFDCVYNGTTIWRIPDTSTFHLVDVNLKLGATTGTKIGTTTSQKLGFWNATPVVQPSAIADATDAASTMARLNDVLAMLRTLGIIAP